MEEEEETESIEEKLKDTFVSSHDGHFVKAGNGRSEGIRNSYEIWETPENELYVKMKVLFSGKEVFTLFDYDDLKKVKDNKTWFVMEIGYVACGSPFIYLHHLVTNFESRGKGFQDFSVDHINRDKLDNRKKNLRLATPKEQQENSKGRLEGTKRERQKQAIKLPDGIIQDDLQIYVNYRIEYSDSSKIKKIKEYFVVENHPVSKRNVYVNGIRLKSDVKSTMSLNVSPKDKLKEIKEILELMNDILKESVEEDTLEITRPETPLIEKITGKSLGARAKKINVYDLNNNLVRSYPSKIQAAKQEKCSENSIYRAVKSGELFKDHYYREEI